MNPNARRSTLDALRIAAAHLIVWHHFALYSGMADAAWSLAPQVFGFLVDHARKAVQVFLVLGGFLVAKVCMGAGEGHGVRAVGQRFMRLAPMVWLALAFVVVIGTTMGVSGDEPRSSWAVQFGRLVANALMLQDVLGVPAVSPGLWYVAIDLQLFALSALLAWWGRSLSAMARMWIVAAAVIASAWIFNRDPSWDAWAPYFVGAYGLGVLAWCVGTARPGATAAMVAATIGVVAALVFDFRDRLLIALVVAWALAVWLRASAHARHARHDHVTRTNRALATHADATYALFLLHDPVRRVVEAVWSRGASADARAQLMGLVVAWVASVLIAHVATRLFGRRTVR